MQKVSSFFSAFAAELRRPATVRVGKAVLITFILFSLLSFSVSADTTISNFILDSNSIVPNSTSILLTGSNITEYTLDQLKVIDLQTDWPYGRDGFRSTLRVQSWYPQSNESYNIHSISWSCSFKIPDQYFQAAADERYLVFTIYGRLSSSTYTQPIDDTTLTVTSSIDPSGTSFQPSKTQVAGTGNYYTFVVDRLNLNDPQFNLHFNFGDFPSHTPDVLGRTVYLTFQISPVVSYTSLSAAAAYGASIDTLLKNNIQPTLENITTVQDSILTEIQDLDSKIEGSVDTAVSNVITRLDNEGSSAIDRIIQQLQDQVDLSIVNDLYTAANRFAQAFVGDHVEFSLTFPAIEIPNIPGIFPGARLNEPYTFDFQDVFDTLPATLVLVVRLFCTFTLCVFVVKDFLRTINSMVSGDDLIANSGLGEGYGKPIVDSSKKGRKK